MAARSGHPQCRHALRGLPVVNARSTVIRERSALAAALIQRRGAGANRNRAVILASCIAHAGKPRTAYAGTELALAITHRRNLLYSTCLFCHTALGRNEVLEAFPVGRRLAFDAHRGRLWVVCRHCRNWNLSPLESRWEAVEDCERIFRATPTRVSTEHIGLAVLSEGLELVRVGKPLRPEFAAWRYGARRRRRRLHTVSAAASTALHTGVAMIVGVAASAVSVAVTASGSRVIRDTLLRGLEQAESRVNHDRVLARVRMPGGALHALQFNHLARLEIIADGADRPWILRLAHRFGITDLQGAHAVHVAGQVLSRINVDVGSSREIRDATRRITDVGDAERYIRASSALRVTRRRKNSIFWDDSVGVLGLTPVERIALEIAVNEDAERSAMQGELAALEAAWRDAEEIAAIADSLFVTP